MKLKLFFLLITLSTSVYAQFEDKITALIAQDFLHADVGIIVRELPSGEIRYQLRANENFYPASNTKLLTAACALKKLGPDFQFETSLQQKGDNLYLVFSGDPAFSKHDLFSLFEQSKIKAIKGDIIIDDSAFDDINYAPGWSWEDMPWYFAAPVQAIILNENKLAISFKETKKLGDKIPATLSDAFPFKLHANIKAVTALEAEKNCSLNAKMSGETISLTGCWPIDQTPATIEVAVVDPRFLAQSLIESLGIPYSGKIRFGQVPKDSTVLAVKRSPLLKTMLVKVLADSNNIYTESLTKTLGLREQGVGSFQAGTLAIQSILGKEMLLDLTHHRLRDGSGVSRYNLLSPALISQLLYVMYSDPLFPFFYDTLAVSGKKGTLASRLKSAEGKIVAKTGSATGTSALSGYLTANNNKRYLFSMMINQSTLSNGDLKAFEDELCQLLIEDAF